MRALKSYGIALVLVLVAAGWLVTGTLIRGGLGPVEGEKSVVSVLEKDGGPITNAIEASGFSKTEHHEKEEAYAALSISQRSELTAGATGDVRSVRVKTYLAQSMNLTVPLRGHTIASASVVAVAESDGIVESIAVTKGQTVKKGDLICILDPGTRQANVANAKADLIQAEAALELAKTGFTTNQRLREKGLATTNSSNSFVVKLRAAEAGIEAKAVAVKYAARELAKTKIHASISGTILNEVVEVGTYLKVASACASIVRLDPMIFVGSIPQVQVDLTKLGLPAMVKTINGQTVDGNISFISPRANEATRTFEIEIEFPNADGKILDGLTAEASVEMGSIPAHLLPQSVMTLDESGVLGVRTVETNKVRFYPLTILNDIRDGVWVGGLPAKADVIILGQEYVKAGQTVNATNVTVKAPS